MAFDVYPIPPTNPLSVAATSTSALISITERQGPDNTDDPDVAADVVTSHPNTMFIRLAMHGPTPAPAQQPTIILQANTGAETEITGGYSPPTPIPDGVAVDTADGIKHDPDANNVYLIKVLLYTLGLT